MEVNEMAEMDELEVETEIILVLAKQEALYRNKQIPLYL
jgi:hypothetical protein